MAAFTEVKDLSTRSTLVFCFYIMPHRGFSGLTLKPKTVGEE